MFLPIKHHQICDTIHNFTITTDAKKINKLFKSSSDYLVWTIALIWNGVTPHLFKTLLFYWLYLIRSICINYLEAQFVICDPLSKNVATFITTRGKSSFISHNMLRRYMYMTEICVRPPESKQRSRESRYFSHIQSKRATYSLREATAISALSSKQFWSYSCIAIDSKMSKQWYASINNPVLNNCYF